MKKFKNWIMSGFRPQAKTVKAVDPNNCDHYWSNPREHVLFANAQERMCKHCKTIQHRYSDGYNRWSEWEDIEL